MAISKEDNKDISRKLGKPIAKAVKSAALDNAKHESPAYKAYKQGLLEKEKKMGQERVKWEKEANPDLPSAKKSIRRKGFSQGKAFHLALEQTRRYDAKRAPIMSKHIPDITKKDYTSMMKSIKKTGSYSSPAHKQYMKGQPERDKKRAEYERERSERYKRDGITE